MLSINALYCCTMYDLCGLACVYTCYKDIQSVVHRVPTLLCYVMLYWLLVTVNLTNILLGYSTANGGTRFL